MLGNWLLSSVFSVLSNCVAIVFSQAKIQVRLLPDIQQRMHAWMDSTEDYQPMSCIEFVCVFARRILQQTCVVVFLIRLITVAIII